MRIKTILVLTAVVTLLLAGLVIAAGAVVSARTREAERRLQNATDLSLAAFQRIALRSEWRILKSESASVQWKKMHNLVYELLRKSEVEYRGTAWQGEIEAVIGYQSMVADHFDKLLENWSAVQSGRRDPSDAARVEDALVSEMNAKAQEVVELSTRLSEQSLDELLSAVDAGVTLSVLTVVVLAVLAAANVLVVGTLVLRGLASLQDGMKRVSEGDLDFRIEVAGRNEITELGRSFNVMAERVKGKGELIEGQNVVFREGMSGGSEDEIARACLSVAERLTGASFGFLGLLNEEGRLDTKSMGETGWERCVIPESLATALVNDMELTSYWGRTIMRGETQVVNDPRSDPDSTGVPDGHPPIESFLGVPLKLGGDTVGVIGLANREGGFGDEDVEDLEALGSTFIEALGRHRAEEELRLHRDRLEEMVEERASELRSAIAELERSNAELQQFAYVASHDLQEPLRMVASYTQLLASRYRGKLDSDADEFIAYAVDGAGRMQRLINDLLALSRVATVPGDVSRTDANLALGFARVNMEAMIDETGAVVTSEDLPEVTADETQLSQVFQNLIANSLKFRGDEPPRVHVSAEHGEGGWVFRVKDNGIGFDQEHAERIFQVFQRLHPRGRYDGTGIGLSICRKIVERHGGRIWAESAPGMGATFYFTIPEKGEEQ